MTFVVLLRDVPIVCVRITMGTTWVVTLVCPDPSSNGLVPTITPVYSLSSRFDSTLKVQRGRPGVADAAAVAVPAAVEVVGLV
jgi:hypothetical protein